MGEECPTRKVDTFGQISLVLVGVRANIHLGGQTEFCPNGEHNLFVTRPRQGEKIIMN